MTKLHTMILRLCLVSCLKIRINGKSVKRNIGVGDYFLPLSTQSTSFILNRTQGSSVLINGNTIDNGSRELNNKALYEENKLLSTEVNEDHSSERPRSIRRKRILKEEYQYDDVDYLLTPNHIILQPPSDALIYGFEIKRNMPKRENADAVGLTTSSFQQIPSKFQIPSSNNTNNHTSPEETTSHRTAKNTTYNRNIDLSSNPHLSTQSDLISNESQNFASEIQENFDEFEDQGSIPPGSDSKPMSSVRSQRESYNPFYGLSIPSFLSEAYQNSIVTPKLAYEIGSPDPRPETDGDKPVVLRQNRTSDVGIIESLFTERSSKEAKEAQLSSEEDPHDNEIEDQSEKSSLRGRDMLAVGKAINIFPRYGFLTLSMKVRPPIGADNYLFLENTAEVFRPKTYWAKRGHRRGGGYDDHFSIHFCQNLDELLTAYYDHFAIEGIPKSHKAFSSSLTIRDVARQFGVNSSFLRGSFSFVLVRLFKREKRYTLEGPQEVTDSVRAALETVRRNGNESAVQQFFESYGSHVITDFELGDMVYQIFVFGDRLYKELKNQFAAVNSEQHLEQLQAYFTPGYATSIGSVKLASGNVGLYRVIFEGYFTSQELAYNNIFRLFEDAAMEEKISKLDGEVLLGLKLSKVTHRLPGSAVTRYMANILDNTMAIYYHHLAHTRKNSR